MQTTRMGRRLVLMRHAKSDWDVDPETGERPPDHDRPLNARGRRDAPRIADWLAAQGWVPDAVVSSTARRTRETWALAGPALGGAPVVRFERSLYLAGLGALQDSARTWDSGWQTVLALGHNPGWEEAASRLAGERLGMVTGTCVLLASAAGTWSAALEGDWRLVGVMHPRALAD